MRYTNSINLFTDNLYYSYQQHFQIAVTNLEEIIREERLLKRIRKSKNR